jgi:deoxyribonuclease (pyrimidine dimer)
MTRINVVPVIELCNKHLFAEWREMPRLVSNLDTTLNRKSSNFSWDEISPEYLLGKGHVKFFFDKFKWLHNRHIEITTELIKRGYELKKTDSSIFKTVDGKFYGDYNVTLEALEINRNRINIRMPKKPTWKKKT